MHSFNEIYIVDDDPVIRLIHKKIVSQSKFKPQTRLFNHGREALDFMMQLGNKQTSILILLDINMPVMNSWEFLNALDKYNPIQKISVVIVTSSINKQDKNRAFQNQFVADYVEKPLSTTTLNGLFS